LTVLAINFYTSIEFFRKLLIYFLEVWIEFAAIEPDVPGVCEAAEGGLPDRPSSSLGRGGRGAQ